MGEESLEESGFLGFFDLPGVRLTTRFVDTIVHELGYSQKLSVKGRFSRTSAMILSESQSRRHLLLGIRDTRFHAHPGTTLRYSHVWVP